MVEVVYVPSKGGTLAYLTKQAMIVRLPFDTKAYGLVQENERVFKDFDILGIDGQKAHEGYRGSIFRTTEKFHLMLTNTLACNSQCRYCYAPHGKHASLEPDSLEKFLRKNVKKFNEIIVFGGDSLMDDDLVPTIRKHSDEIVIQLVTGMAFEKGEFEKKVLAALKNKAIFSVSIDPLPRNESVEYPRIFAPYSGNKNRDWYREKITRLGWLHRHTLAWGIRPTLTDDCFDFRALRQDVERATGASKIRLNADSVNDSSFSPETISELEKILDQEADDIINGKLDLRYCHHLVSHVRTLHPWTPLGTGGCFAFFNRLSIGPDSQLSFCNEISSQCDGGENTFGNLHDGIDKGRYKTVIRRILNTSCPECPLRFLCGISCPIHLPDQKRCFYYLKSMASLKIMANIDNPEAINELAKTRSEVLKKLESTPKITDREMEDRAEKLCEPIGNSAG